MIKRRKNKNKVRVIREVLKLRTKFLKHQKKIFTVNLKRPQFLIVHRKIKKNQNFLYFMVMNKKLIINWRMKKNILIFIKDNKKPIKLQKNHIIANT